MLAWASQLLKLDMCQYSQTVQLFGRFSSVAPKRRSYVDVSTSLQSSVQRKALRTDLTTTVAGDHSARV